MLANATGTLLAATVLYLYGVAVGAIRANWRVLAPIIVAAVATVLFLVMLEIDNRVDKRFHGPGLRRLLSREGLSALYGIPVFTLVAFAMEFWTDQGLPIWAYAATFFGLSALGLLTLRIWKSRRRRFAARTKKLD
jgi:hypothetical protein